MKKPRVLVPRRSLQLESFLVGLGLAVLLFVPFIIFDKGYFLYYGDFNVQQLTFYKLAHEAVREGNIFWNWGTDLGANFIGSYSFYLLGSPFFWLTLPFPNEWIYYLMGPLLILKFACACAAAYAFLQRFVRPQLALVGGLLYAFSGFSVYNIFFNHFHEAIIYFPLMLLGLELYMTENRRGVFALFVFLSALSNYYFLAGQAVFILIYFLIRLASPDWHCSVGKFLGLLLETVLGAAMAAVLLLPAFFAVIQNPRTGNIISGWGTLIYSKEQRLFDIIHSFFFPQDNPARAYFFPSSDNKWASMSAWLPVFGCTGALAYFQSRRHTDWLRRMLIICVICAVIPVFNAAFQLFNSMYYARWFYMPVLLMVLATVMCFEECDTTPVEWRRAFGWSAGITAFFAVIVGLMPKSWEPNEDGRLSFGLMGDHGFWPFWATVGIAVIALVLGGLLVSVHRRDRAAFYRAAAPIVAAACLLYGWYHVGSSKASGYYSGEFMRSYAVGCEDLITLPETDTVERVDMHGCLDNQAMFWEMYSINAFHSIVPGSVMEFYPTVGVQRSVGSRPGTERYALRSFLSVRWLFDYANDDGLLTKEDSAYFEQDGVTSMPGWHYYDKQNGVLIYENEYCIPMGFTYDAYLLRSEYDALSQDNRELVLLKALVIDDADEAAVSDLLTHFDTSTAVFSAEEYYKDCGDRANLSCDSVAEDNRGFTATISSGRETVVFFSVPYENGWSAAVDGKPAEILKAGAGFMAVRVPAGRAVEIRFDYMTPGLLAGLCVSGGAAVLLGLYLLITALVRRSTSKAVSDLADGRRTAEPRLQPQEAGGFDMYEIYRDDVPDGGEPL